MKKYTWLMEVREKHTGRNLLPIEEYQTDTDDIYFAKHRYLNVVQESITYRPSVKRALDGKNWYIDGVLL